jgi:hypothetical protein
LEGPARTHWYANDLSPCCILCRPKSRARFVCAVLSINVH